ncbi:Uncharacterized protein HA466_0142400 [Hirschfeldia incana]|nr:Uncharacterized protein HA466_0142400 [Hirschfeldia incana]
MAESESEHEVIVEEGELEKLETEVKEMAKKISEYRKTLPDNIRNTLDSALSSTDTGSDPLPSSSSSSQRLAIPPGTEEQECEQKMLQLKEILSRNAENISKVVKRARECTEAIQKLDSLDRRTIHPAFTRRRLN